MTTQIDQSIIDDEGGGSWRHSPACGGISPCADCLDRDAEGWDPDFTPDRPERRLTCTDYCLDASADRILEGGGYMAVFDAATRRDCICDSGRTVGEIEDHELVSSTLMADRLVEWMKARGGEASYPDIIAAGFRIMAINVACRDGHIRQAMPRPDERGLLAVWFTLTALRTETRVLNLDDPAPLKLWSVMFDTRPRAIYNVRGRDRTRRHRRTVRPVRPVRLHGWDAGGDGRPAGEGPADDVQQ